MADSLEAPGGKLGVVCTVCGVRSDLTDIGGSRMATPASGCTSSDDLIAE
jgi:hypothetical protein